jgi:hypothetical protein
MIVRLMCSLITIVMLTAACGGTTVDGTDDALVAAEAEIAELEEQLQVMQSEARPVAESDEVIDSFVKSGELPKGLSQGPCGVFRIDGRRILKLDYESTWGPYRWVDSGIDYPASAQALWSSHGDTPTLWLERPPDVALAFRVTDDRNHFFWLQWQGTFYSLPEWSSSGAKDDLEDLYGASVVSIAGFFGPDSNCEWGWVPIGYSDGVGSKYLVINSGLTIEEDEETFDWWFTEYVWKDYSCEETPPPLSTVTYDPGRHMFVSECRDG